MKKTKQIICSLILSAALILAIPFAACEIPNTQAVPVAKAITSESCGKDLSWNFNSATGVLTISGTGDMYYFSIPQGGIIEITPPWYSVRSQVKKIVVADGVTSIGEYAFYGCSNAETAEIASSVQSIGKKAFRGCSSLTQLDLSDGLETIGENAFENCDGLVYVTLPETVVTISENAFFSCSKLEQINLPKSVETIGKKAFYSCEALKGIAIPEKVKAIEEKTFYQCYKLASVTFAEGLETIGTEAFEKCGALQSVIFPETLKEIGEMAFYSCGSLSEVVVRQQVKVIDDKAFSQCKNLASLTLSDGLEEIGTDAFACCEALESLTLPKTLKTVGDGAFRSCTNLSKIENRGKITKFGVIVFYATKWLNEYPDKVVYLGDVLYGVNGEYTDSVLTVKDATRLIADSALNNLSSVTQVKLPFSVEIIGNYAFYNCTALKEISLSKNVSQIGQKAFMNCNELSDITIYNPLCSIYDAQDTLPTDTVITSFETSTAHEYAVQYSRKFKAHMHAFEEVQSTPATCTKDGEILCVCPCGAATAKIVPATGHTDSNQDGVCDVCSEDLTKDCTCICHKTGISTIIYKILRIFWKIFKINPVCDCGALHY
ncbi:MAG: leucine-rich repeat domain-containing protein [Acutalibacteraceae bacterium]